MAKALSQFHAAVLPHALGCPEPLLNQALLYAAAEFCKRTLVVQEISTQSIRAGVTDYDVDVPTDNRLASVLGVWYGDTPLAAASTSQVRLGTAFTDAMNAPSGSPSAFFQKVPHDPIITLYPRPATTEPDALVIRAAYEPSINATTLHDALFAYHVQDVAAGAIAYLTALPSQAFTNPTVAADFRVRFEFAIHRVKPAARTGRVQQSQYIQPRRFA